MQANWVFSMNRRRPGSKGRLKETIACSSVDGHLQCPCMHHRVFVLGGCVLTGSLLRRGLTWSSLNGFDADQVLRLFPALRVPSAVSALFRLLDLQARGAYFPIRQIIWLAKLY